MENIINMNFAKLFDKNGDKIKNHKRFMEERKKHFPGYKYVFTDGSKKEDGQCGYGVQNEIDQKGISGKINSINIFSCVCQTILQDLLFIKKSDKKKWIIFTDSLSAIKQPKL